MRLAGGADHGADARLMARAADRSARGPRVREQLRLGVVDPCRAELHRRSAGRVAVLLPAGLPASRSRLRGLDPALEEVAHSLGHNRWRTFLHVTLPGVRPAILGGGLLVGLHVLSEFGALQMLRFPTFTTAIYDQYRSAFNSAPANMLAG